MAKAKRELISPRGDDRYIRRDDRGRSQAVDRRTKAKTRVTSGQGDRGDRAVR